MRRSLNLSDDIAKRNSIENRHFFMTTSNPPWKELMNEIDQIYNFEEINTINLLE